MPCPRQFGTLKKLMAKHWDSMGQANLEVVIRSIIDTGYLHLQQHVTSEGPEVVDLVKVDVPKAWKFIHELPKKQQRREEKEIIMSIFDHNIRGPSTPVDNSCALQLSGQNNGQRHYLHCGHEMQPYSL